MATCRPSDDIAARLAAEVLVLRAPREAPDALVQSAFEEFVGIARNGQVLAWNRQAELTFGWSRAEMIGRDMAERIIPLHLRPSHARGLARYLATGEGPVLTRRIEVSALH